MASERTSPQENDLDGRHRRRVMVMVSEEDLTEIERYWMEQRRSHPGLDRSSAIRALIQQGLSSRTK